MITKEFFKRYQAAIKDTDSLLQSSEDLRKIDCDDAMKKELNTIAQNIAKYSYLLQNLNEQALDTFCNISDCMMRRY